MCCRIQLVTWILVIVVVFSIVYFFAVFAAELYVICGPSRVTTEKIKNMAKADNSVTDVAMNPMFSPTNLRVWPTQLCVAATSLRPASILFVAKA